LEWVTKSSEDSHKILSSYWHWGSQTLFLKKWRLYFNAKSEHLEVIPVFVWILALPLIFWTKDVFKEMGNLLGFYYEVYFVENTQQY
jgi:hypothetical protein